MSEPSSARPRLGLIINPIAGMGGRVALKGTDGSALADARRLGAEPTSSARAATALAALDHARDSIELLAGSGDMGEKLARAQGFEPTCVGPPRQRESRAHDTREIAAAMAELGADLILFAGGDGTARDVAGAVEERVPVLGVPAGVKMQSGVFATTPAAAGRVAAAFLAQPTVARRAAVADVCDLDEAALRLGHILPVIFGRATVPAVRVGIAPAKSRSASSPDQALLAACETFAHELAAGELLVLGPGTTMQALAAALGVSGTLCGVDVVSREGIVASDIGEHDLLRLVRGRPTSVALGVIGGAGVLLGRGNQQISARVLRAVGHQRVHVFASVEKLVALPRGCLLVDTGDAQLDTLLSGHRTVRTGPRRTMIVRVDCL